MLCVVVTGVALAYAIVRYNLCAGVPWSQLPLFVSNKGLSLASVVLIGLAYLANRRLPLECEARRARLRLARQAGLAGFWLMVLHVAISLAILDGRHYPVLVDAAGLTRAGMACVIMGTCGTLVFALPALSSVPRVSGRLPVDAWKRSQQVGYVALAFTSAHVIAVGGHNFFAVSRWPCTLPPISLISLLACLVPIGAKLASISRRR